MVSWYHCGVMDDANRSTLRVPGELHGEMVAEARRLGVSLNALVLVAVRDYLDRRATSASAASSSSATVSAAEGQIAGVRGEGEPLERPRSDLKVPGGVQVPARSAKRKRRGKR